MSKKIVSICLSLIILAGMIYTVASNFVIAKERNSGDEQVDLSSLIQEVEPPDKGEITIEEPVVEYRSIDEPEAHDLDSEEGHSHGDEERAEVQELNVQAPDFELETLSGETVKLSDLKGKRVFINFWATWCTPCVEEMPTIQHFYEEYANQEDIVILAVNATDLELKLESVKQFADEYGISFPILLDEKGDVSINYEILTIPTSVIINEAGMIVERIIGPVTEEMLVSKLIEE
ncbi:redoxin domain-containing protein [Lysinibacillus fusiformis]|nr:redoxin domain-containing protein [Lysinibacillus fusiformis]